MFFFLINNNFHFDDALLHIENEHIPVDLVHFICIPHTLDMNRIKSYGYNYSLIVSPLIELQGFINVFSLFRTRLLVNDLCSRVCVSDTLFLYTEYELLNQLVIKKFHKLGANVFMIEENGLASYAVNKMASKSQSRLLVLNDIKFLLPAIVWGCTSSRMVESDGNVFPIGDDKALSGIIYYANVTVERNVKQVFIEKRIKKDIKVGGDALYLNQDLYNFYMSKSDFLSYLDLVIAELLCEFSTVKFKFHPREVGTNIVTELMERYPDVDFIADNVPIEHYINSLKPKLIVSFNSSALINLRWQGWDVNFTFTKWPGYISSPMLLAIASSIDEMNRPLNLCRPMIAKSIFDIS